MKIAYYLLPMVPKNEDDIEWHNANLLKFTSSYDWLMPVVEKIESISYIGIDAIYFQIKSKQAQIWTYFDIKEFLRLTGDDKNADNKFKISVSGKTKIEAVYGAVIEFIKWYAKQNP
jgi:hypothetical protein